MSTVYCRFFVFGIDSVLVTTGLTPVSVRSVLALSAKSVDSAVSVYLSTETTRESNNHSPSRNVIF